MTNRFLFIFILLTLLTPFAFSQSNQHNASGNTEDDSSGRAGHFRKEPYLLFTGINTEMLVAWQTDSSCMCLLSWGIDTTYTDGLLEASDYGNDHQYKILIQDLLPETHYFYRVSCGQEDISTGSFVTGATNNNPQLSFYVYGDTRTNPAIHNEVVSQILMETNQQPSYQTFIISTGDLVANGNNESDWQEQFFDPQYVYIRQMMSELPYVAAVGNHEGQGILFQKYFPYPMFISDRYYYSFDDGPAHFTVIDQLTDYSEGSPQYNWLVNDLASTEKQWKFILLHKPGWSAGGGHPNSTQVQQFIQPLCEMYGVQFVLGGHNHYYARAVVNGVNHITAGGGGAPLYNPNPVADHIVMVSKTHHYCRVDIEGDALTFTATDKDGNLIENFNQTLNPGDVNENPLDKDFRIYSTGKVITVVNENGLKGRIHLYDLYGRRIFNKRLIRGENQMAIDTTGIYFVRILYAKNKSAVKKVYVK